MVLNILAGFEVLLSTSLPLGSINNSFTSGVDVEIRAFSNIPFLSLGFTSYTNQTYTMRFSSIGGGIRFTDAWFTMGVKVNGMMVQRWYFGGYERLFSPLLVLLFEPGWYFKQRRFFLTIKIKEVFNETITPDIVDIGIGIGM